MTEDKTQLRFRSAPEAVWQEAILKQIKTVAHWEKEWSFQLEKYKQLQEDTAKANVFHKSKEQEAEIVDHPKYPVTTAKEIGWLANDPRFSLERFGRYSRPIRTLYKAFEWPIEGCP
ncbi:hypothetical protein HNY73_022977 [Argiope bruennichi]|uniref:Uncharacterized protein n=1 Tax=Argiope bruennichi TaxID=94029 RepID=A0A8T0E6Y6_ARGBR|nr:hypothetical protein HNY73_022977 [Argiope bruennichi]